MVLKGKTQPQSDSILRSLFLSFSPLGRSNHVALHNKRSRTIAPHRRGKEKEPMAKASILEAATSKVAGPDGWTALCCLLPSCIMYTRIDISDTSNLYQETEGEVKNISMVRAFYFPMSRHTCTPGHVCCCDIFYQPTSHTPNLTF